MTFFNSFQPENIIKIITRNMGFQPLIAVSQKPDNLMNYGTWAYLGKGGTDPKEKSGIYSGHRSIRTLLVREKRFR